MEPAVTLDLHRAKAERITRSLAKCSPSDYEAVIEGVMLAGTHWFNLGLHAFGLIPPERDVMHAEFLTGAERLKIGLVAPRLVEALEEVEASRALFVRGNAAGGEAAARRALELLAGIRDAALAARPIRQRRRDIGEV
jgi:hypothetical protein